MEPQKLESRRMTKRSRNGPRCRQYHAVPVGWNHYRHALCGAQPKIGALKPDGHPVRHHGWSSEKGQGFTCSRCLELWWPE
jgi:hypothetical protein